MRAYLLAALFFISWVGAACMLSWDLGALSALPPIVMIILIWRMIPQSSLLGVALDLLLGALLATSLLLPTLLLPAAAFALLLLPLGALAIWVSGRSLQGGSIPEAASRSEEADGAFSFREGL